MIANLVVGLAAVVQYAAAALALRVPRIMRREPAWMFIAAVAFLMAIRRSIVLYRSLSHDTTHPSDLTGESVALAISVLMVVGIARIGPFFLSIVRSRDELQSKTRDLRERVKELDCLFAMADLVNRPGASLEDTLQGAVDLIPSGWQYPQITCARVLWDCRAFGTSHFEETPWKQSCDLVVQGERVGCLEVSRRRTLPAGRAEPDQCGCGAIGKDHRAPAGRKGKGGPPKTTAPGAENGGHRLVGGWRGA